MATIKIELSFKLTPAQVQGVQSLNRGNYLVGTPRGLGLDPRTAIVIGADRQGRVMGSGHAYLVHGSAAPSVCSAGMPLTFEDVPYQRFADGDILDFSSRPFGPATLTLSVTQGVLSPADPY